MSEHHKWFKDRSGWWNFGILLVMALGLLGTVGVWALAAQDATQIARNSALKTNLSALKTNLAVEVKRIDGNIVDIKNDLREVSAKIDMLDMKVDTKIDKLDMKINTKIDKLDMKINTKIDGATTEIKADIRLITEMLMKVLPGTAYAQPNPQPIPPKKGRK